MAEVRPVPVRIQVTDGALIPGKGDKTVRASWKIALFGALGLLVFLPLYNMAPVQEFVLSLWASLFPSPELTARLVDLRTGKYQNIWVDILLYLPDGLSVTFSVTLSSILLATVFGLAAGLGQISRVVLLNRIATVYVEVIRGIPLLVQIFYIYFALGSVFHLDGFFAAVLSMAFCYGAYMGEIFRAGIQAVPVGQMEAALALGLSRTQAIRLIILPQTVKIILPAIGNEFIALLKDSSMVSVMALVDLLRLAKNYGSNHGDYFPPLTVVALVYLVMTLILSWLVALMEERLNQNAR
ncbi:MAG: amino acid ABC transporter permease [Spirochaetales bacterium]